MTDEINMRAWWTGVADDYCPCGGSPGSPVAWRPRSSPGCRSGPNDGCDVCTMYHNGLRLVDRLESAEAELSRLRAVVGEVLDILPGSSGKPYPASAAFKAVRKTRAILRRGEVGG
jgi:hypothetical protein